MPAKLVRILLVDDHKVLRDGLRALLESEDDLVVIAEAGTGQEAITLTETHLPDVIVMDLGDREVVIGVAGRQLGAQAHAVEDRQAQRRAAQGGGGSGQCHVHAHPASAVSRPMASTFSPRP